MPLKIGLLGAGTIGYPHLHAYVKNKNVAEVVVAEISEPARKRLCDRYQIKKSTADYKTLLADPSIDVVDICLPSFLHQSVALEAFAAGKHVICEKPLALTPAGAAEMARAAQKASKRLFGVLNQRFMPMHEQARQLLDAGRIGRPMFMTSFICGNEIDRLNDPNHWKGDREKSGGGVLADAGVHHVDLMLFFLGKPKSVFAALKRVMVKPVNKEEDNAFVTVEFESGAVGNLIASFSMTELPWTEPKTIYGTGGTIVIDDSADPPLRLVLAEKKEVCDDGFTRCTKTRTEPVALDKVPADNPNPLWYYSLGKCLDDFLDALVTGREPAVTVADNQSALGVIAAAYQSFRTGKRIDL